MPRKFSFDISSLVVNKKTRRESDTQLDSPPQTPKSVRPPLPEDVEAALRAVCAQVFNEGNAAALPDVDHDMITQFWQQTDEKPIKRDSQQSQSLPQRSDSLVAQSEASPEIVRPVQVVAKPRPRSTSQGYLTASIPKVLHRRKPSLQARGDSIDTVNSGTCSDDTDGPLDPSTAITSAVLTPAKASKRTSAQAFSENNRPSAMQSRQESRDGTAINPLGQHPLREFAKTTKIVAAKYYRPSDVEGLAAAARSSPNQQDIPPAPRQRAATYDDASQVDERNGRSTFRSRAASRARSLSRGIRDFIRPPSRRGQPTEPEERRLHSSNAAKPESRPTTGMRKPSMEFFKRGRRASKEFRAPVFDNASQSDISGHESDRGRNAKNLNISTGRRRGNDDDRSQRPRVDLNRELPPLPSLGLWQDDDVQSPENVETAESDAPPPDQVAGRHESESTVPQFAEINMNAEPDTTFHTTSDVHNSSLLPLPKTPTSPLPKMSATAGPGDFDMYEYEPSYVPSPATGSSVKDNESPPSPMLPVVRTSTLSIDFVDTLESPVIVDAKRLSGMSVPDRPQLVHNRAPSIHSARRVAMEGDDVPTLPAASTARIAEAQLEASRPSSSRSARPMPLDRSVSADEVPSLPPKSITQIAEAHLGRYSLDERPQREEQLTRASMDDRLHESRPGSRFNTRTPQNDSKVDIHDRLRNGRHYSRPSVNEALDTARTDAVATPITAATPNTMRMLKKIAKRPWWKYAKGKKPDHFVEGEDQGWSRTFINDSGDHETSSFETGGGAAAAPVVRLS